MRNLFVNLFSGIAQTCQTHKNTENPTDTYKNFPRGDVQLMIPAWRTSRGYVRMREAIVQGNASISTITFQLYSREEKNNCTRYTRCRYITGLQSGNKITAAKPQFSENYYIGIRLRIRDIDSTFGLQYSNTTTEDGVDVYYWENPKSNKYFLDCGAKVLRGITPMVTWEFCCKSNL